MHHKFWNVDFKQILTDPEFIFLNFVFFFTYVPLYIVSDSTFTFFTCNDVHLLITVAASQTAYFRAPSAHNEHTSILECEYEMKAGSASMD